MLTLTLGGLGMFLVVLAATFMAAKVVAKNVEFERFGEEGQLAESGEQVGYYLQ